VEQRHSERKTKSLLGIASINNSARQWVVAVANKHLHLHRTMNFSRLGKTNHVNDA
jgi:hypothetical protein